MGYLNILLASVHFEMRMYGKAKVCSLSSLVLLNNLIGGLLDLILILVYNNRIVRVNDQLLHLLIKARKNLPGKYIAYILFSEPGDRDHFSSIRSSIESVQTDKEIDLDDECGRVYRQKINPNCF